MERKFFGTDGIRGPVRGDRINSNFAARFGSALAEYLRRTAGIDQPVLAIGRDTRCSGTMLRDAVVAGFNLRGGSCRDLGMVPTPAVAQALSACGAHLGLVITASHNPASDNGLKLFRADGTKLSDAEELDIEAAIEMAGVELETASVEATCASYDAETPYIEARLALLGEAGLRGWTIALDTAHGAAWRTSPQVLQRAGAQVLAMGDNPDGLNINENVGSEHPEGLRQLVLETGASLGLAHDGDGDRLLVIDEQGEILPGEALLAMLAVDAIRRDELPGKTLVTTVQSNLGLDRALEAAGGRVVRTSVGDRYVAEAMNRHGSSLGGESSGHIILRGHAPCGDGLLAAVALLRFLRDHPEEPLSSHWRRSMEFFPQRTAAITVRLKPALDEVTGFAETVGSLERELGKAGRLLVRYSGTEPKLRLLVEADEAAKAEAVMERLLAAVHQHLPVGQS